MREARRTQGVARWATWMPWWARLGVSFLLLPAVVLWHTGRMLPEIAAEVRTVVPDLRRQDKDALGARDARLTGVWFDRSGEGAGHQALRRWRGSAICRR